MRAGALRTYLLRGALNFRGLKIGPPTNQNRPTDRARPILRFDLLPNPLAPNKHHSAIKHYLAVVFDALVYGGAHWQGRFWPFQAAAGCVTGLNRSAQGWALLWALRWSHVDSQGLVVTQWYQRVDSAAFWAVELVLEAPGRPFLGWWLHGAQKSPSIGRRSGIAAALRSYNPASRFDCIPGE